MGGMIWEIGAALLEKAEINRRHASYVNDDLAEYLVPVSTDAGCVEVIFVPDNDREVNPLGIKGVGELGIVGVNAAIANAVHHATGRRIRRLPIDGLEGEVDLSRRVRSTNAGVFAPLAEPDRFAQFGIEFGAIWWPGDIARAPDAMHAELEAYGRREL